MLTAYVQGRIFNYDYCVGGIALSGAGWFFPSDFAVGPNRSLYVLSKGYEFLPTQGITKCTLDSEYVWECRGGDYLEGRGPFPSSIALDSDENVYVSDEFKNRIYIFDKDGNPVGDWGSDGSTNGKSTGITLPAPNTVGAGVAFDLYLKKVGARDSSKDGELNGPMGLTFDGDDNLYIADSYNHRIQVFTRSGAFLRKWGSYGCGDGELNLPWGMAVDAEGCVYVADWGNSRVQKFSPDGACLAVFGAQGSGEGELNSPSSVAVDKDGDVYVCDWGANRVNIYEPDGEYLMHFTGDADRLSQWTQNKVDANVNQQRARKRADLSRERYFRRPVTVRVDDEGRIMTLEAVACRIQVYVKEQDWVEPQFNL